MKNIRYVIFLQAHLVRAEMGLGIAFIAFIAFRIQLICRVDMTHSSV